MSKEVDFEWTLSRRQWQSSAMRFKQRFYSTAFDNDYWCLSCYQHDGQLLIQLNLLRLPIGYDSVDFQARCVLSAGQKEIWSGCKKVGSGKMDIEYKNSYKWTVPSSVFANIGSPADNLSIVVRIRDTATTKRQRRNIYNLDSMFDDQ